MTMIYDVRLTLTRDGTWRTTVDGAPAVAEADTAPDALRKTADWMMRGGRAVPERRMTVTIYLDVAQVRAIRALAEERRVPQAVLYREALDRYLSTTTRPMSEASPGLGSRSSDALTEEAPVSRSSPATSGASSDPPSPFHPGSRLLFGEAPASDALLAPPKLPPPPPWVCPLCGLPEPKAGDDLGHNHYRFEPCPEDR